MPHSTKYLLAFLSGQGQKEKQQILFTDSTITYTTTTLS